MMLACGEGGAEHDGLVQGVQQRWLADTVAQPRLARPLRLVQPPCHPLRICSHQVSPPDSPPTTSGSP